MTSEETQIERIIELELNISKNCADNCKYISELFQYLEPDRVVDASVRLKCLHSVRRILPIVFETFQVNLFTHETESPSSFEQVERWLKQQIWKLCTYLEELCVSDNDQVANTALLIGATLSAQFQAWRVLFQRQIKKVIVSSSVGTENWSNFMDNMFSIYGDVALYTLDVIRSLPSIEENMFVLYRIYELLSQGAQQMPNYLSQSNKLQDKLMTSKNVKEENFRKRLKKTFTDAVLFYLSCRLPESIELRILEEMGSTVIPYMTRPLLLVDYLTSLTEEEQRGVVSIMALNALFILIRDYGLDYPYFYDKLYRLLTVRNLMTKPFLRFLGKFLLAGLNISEEMVITFVKKLVRLATRLPPLPCHWCLTCAVHLMVKYPSIARLVHYPTTITNSDSSSTKEYFISRDPFDEFQKQCDSSSHAASSCLWELQLIQRHYMNSIRELFSYFKIDWSLRRKISSLPPKPEDILEQDIDVWIEQIQKTKKRKTDAIWQPDLPYAPLDIFSQQENITLK